MQMWLIIAVVGLVLGAAAYKMVPANYIGGIIGTMLVGMIAGLCGTMIGQRVGVVTQSSGVFAAVISTVIVLVIWRAISKPH